MSTSRLFTTVSIAALAATVLSSTAGFAALPSALAAPMAPAQARQLMPAQMQGFMMQRRGAALDRTDHVEGRIAFLKAELKITDDQAPLWEAVATAMRERSATMNALRDDLRSERAKGDGERDRAERRQTLTAPESLALREEAMSARAKALAVDAEGQRQFTTAFGALYDQLNDEQKKTADQLLAGPRHRS